MIRTEDDIRAGLEALRRLDPRLDGVIAAAGTVPLRRSPAGLRGLAGTIVGQQVSKASAAAIFGRLCQVCDLDDPAAIHAASDEDLRLAGLSGSKQRTLRALADACLSGALDFERLARAEPAQAIAELVVLRGIGVWTAECYLLFSAGHPDVFPSGDLALQVAVGHALRLPERPKQKAVALIAADWSPHRSVAARLFWAYYGATVRRDATPAETVPGDSSLAG